MEYFLCTLAITIHCDKNDWRWQKKRHGIFNYSIVVTEAEVSSVSQTQSKSGMISVIKKTTLILHSSRSINVRNCELSAHWTSVLMCFLATQKYCCVLILNRVTFFFGSSSVYWVINCLTIKIQWDNIAIGERKKKNPVDSWRKLHPLFLTFLVPLSLNRSRYLLN